MNRRTTTGFPCYEGDCRREPNPKLYPSQQSVRQHRVRAHAHESPQETSVWRALKRKREADEEESRERQRLEEEERIEASRVPEPEPPRPVCCQTYSSQGIALTAFIYDQDPSLRAGDRPGAHPVNEEPTEPCPISGLHTDLDCSGSDWAVSNEETANGGGESSRRCCPA